MNKTFRSTAFGIGLLAALAACGNDAPDDNTPGGALTITDAWVKATDSEMTGAFAEFTNTGSDDIRIVDVESPVGAHGELHEIVSDGGNSVMRELDGGVLIPAGQSRALVPGGDHLMLMDLHGPLIAGDDTEITLTFEDGSTVSFTAQVRDFAGNREEYVPGHGHGQ